jgi:WhiB family redox-sensing transcriptional regulator
MTTHLVDLVDMPDLPRAACKGVEVANIFFPKKGNNAPTIAEAKEICGACPEQAACLAWALEHREPGIWGGMTEPERFRLSRTPSALEALR